MEISNELNQFIEYIYNLVLEADRINNNKIIPSIKIEQIYCILKKANKTFTMIDLIYLTEIINLRIQAINGDRFRLPYQKKKRKKDIFI